MVVNTSSGDARSKPKPKYLRVVVDSPDNFGGSGPGRVNVRVPLQLLRAGVRLASLIPAQALGQANVELRKSGVPFDLSQLKPEQLEALLAGLLAAAPLAGCDSAPAATNPQGQPAEGEVWLTAQQIRDAKVHVFCE